MAVNLHQFLSHAIQGRASDIHISTGRPPAFRVHGTLRELENYVALSADHVLTLIQETGNAEALTNLEKGEATSFSYSAPLGPNGEMERFRFNVYPEHYGPTCAIRHIHSTPPTFRELNLPPIIPEFVSGYDGLLLITGATGSGKSTTLGACVNEINKTQNMHIITLEDPIEYVYQGDKSVIHQREVGRHVPSFAEGLIDALRQDPDVIVVGELRGPESIRLALIAAETGHLVIATMHANSAAKAVDRLIAAMPADEQRIIRTLLAESLRCVVSQRLVKTHDRKGRVAAIEVMINDKAIASMIRDGQTHKIEASIQSGRKRGMQTMTDALVNLVQRGIADPKDAAAKAPDRDKFLERLRARRDAGI